MRQQQIRRPARRAEPQASDDTPPVTDGGRRAASLLADRVLAEIDAAVACAGLAGLRPI